MKYRTFFQIKTLTFKVIALGLYVFFCLSILTFDPADQFNTNVWPNQEPTNWCGEAGARAASVFYQLFGYGVYLMVYLGGFHLLRFFFGYHAKYYRLRFCGYAICQLAVCAFITLFFCNNLDVPNLFYGDNGFSETCSTNLIYGHGGMVGVSWAAFFARGGPFFANLMILLTLGFGFFLYSDFVAPFILRRLAHLLSRRSLRRVLPWIWWFVRPRLGWKRVFDERIRRRPIFLKGLFLSKDGGVPNDLDGNLPATDDEEWLRKRQGRGNATAQNANALNAQREAVELSEISGLSGISGGFAQNNADAASGESENRGEQENQEAWENSATRKSQEKSERSEKSRQSGESALVYPDSTPRNLTAGNPLLAACESEATDGVQMKERHEEDGEEYAFPSLELLAPADDVDYSEMNAEAENRELELVEIFKEFGLEVAVKDFKLGPTITQFQVEPPKGIRVNKIASLADDLAVKLGVPNVRIVFPLSGKPNLIGIEVPNRKKQLVRLREVMERLAGTYDRISIPMFLGKDVAGRPLIADLAALPHLLIAGRTGTGKSVCLNSIITSIIMTRSPADVRMLMIDPKMVEMSQYREIPHLMHPVVTDMKKAEAILNWAVEKMEERYRWLARAGVRHIKDYNKLSYETKLKRIKPKAGEETPKTMPFIVIVVDEMADLMMTAPKDVESHIIRLAQKSRAVGIHLILATQKPIVTVITSLIKSNLPARIAFQVSSKTDSRVVLDENGADRLLGNGDMLFLQPGTSILVRAQGTYLSDDEIDRVVGGIAVGEPQFESEIERRLSGGDSGKLAEWAARDEFYIQAIDIIVKERRGSITLLQRMLGIGYGRAARLIDFMEEDKIVGPFSGYTKPREVLLTKEVWQAMQAELNQEQEKAIQAELARVAAEKAMKSLEDESGENGETGEDLTEDETAEEDLAEEDLAETGAPSDEKDWAPGARAAEKAAEKRFREKRVLDEYFADEPDEEELEEELDGESDWELDGAESDAGEAVEEVEDEEVEDEEVPWNEEIQWDEETEEPLYPRPSRPVERSRGKSRRRRTPNYEKIFTMKEKEADTVNSSDSQDVLRRIEPNQPTPFLRDEEGDFRKIN